jgi:glutaredoxin 3|tara:strand:- start:344 stop:580 length:237 start_codon:yes stop_codon:yes gene_type:complete
MNFIVYSRDGCPYCTKIIKVLDLIEAKFVEYKLNRDFTREEFYGEFGKGTTFPQILMDQKKLGGCSETVKYLREQKLL